MINLLPPQEKEKLYGRLLKRQVRAFGFLAAIILFGGAVFVLNTWVFLKIQTKAISRNLNLETREPETVAARGLESQVKDLNLWLARYQNFRAESGVLMSDVLLKVQEIVPRGAALDALLVDSLEKKIILSGRASRREDVVVMENRLKKSEYFERVNSPISNYLEKTNASFNFSFYYK